MQKCSCVTDCLTMKLYVFIKRRLSYVCSTVTGCAVASVQLGSSLAPLSCVVRTYVCTYIADVWCGWYYQARHCIYHVLCWVTGTLVLCLRLMGLPEGSLWCHVSVQMYVRTLCSLYVSICSVLWLPLLRICVLVVVLIHLFLPTYLQPLGPRSDSQFWAFLVFLHGNVWPLQNILHMCVSDQRLYSGLPPQLSLLVSPTRTTHHIHGHFMHCVYAWHGTYHCNVCSVWVLVNLYNLAGLSSYSLLCAW